MSIVLKTPSNGSVTLAEQDTASDVTVTIPATAGNAVISTPDLAYSPFIGFRNRIINGAMTIAQRGTAAITADGFPVDRFLVSNATDGAFSAQQDASAPAGFINSTKFTTTTADASLGSTQSIYLQQRIEGNNVADLGFGTANAQTITASFWVRSSLTGTFGGSIINDAFNRSYPFSYTISSADTWEQKSVTIAGDTTGTWTTNTSRGMILSFSLGAGADRVGTAGAWSGTNTQGVTGQVQVIGTLNATFYITGVQLEKGSTATPFEFRSIGTELALCQRYYWKNQPDTTASKTLGTGFNNLTTNMYVFVSFPVPMRTSPAALEQSGTAADYQVLHGNTGTSCNSVPTFGESTIYGSRINAPVASGLTAGQGAMFRALISGTGYLAWSAEL